MDSSELELEVVSISEGYDEPESIFIVGKRRRQAKGLAILSVILGFSMRKESYGIEPLSCFVPVSALVI
jgi:hypothetical protein